MNAIGALTMTPFPVDPEKDTICDVIRRWAETQSNAPPLLSEENAPPTYSVLAAHSDDIDAFLISSGLGRGWPIDREDGSDKQWKACS